METENTAHLTLYGTIASLVFCVAVAGFFHFAPVYDAPAAMATVPPAAAVAQPALAECLPSGNGAPCIPFDKIQEMMDAQPAEPEPIPANTAAANEEKI
jgi:hypothetical protein